MSCETPQELNFPGLIEFGPWISWGARHADEIDDVIDAAEEWAAVPAVPIRPKWEVTKSGGDTVVGVIEDAPPFVQAVTMEYTSEMIRTESALFGGDGSRWARFIKTLPAIIAIVTQLAGLFGK